MATARSVCTECGEDLEKGATPTELCHDCITAQLFTHNPSPSEVVAALQKLTRLGALYPLGGKEALERAKEVAERLIVIIQSISSIAIPIEEESRPDDIVGLTVSNVLDEGHFGIQYSWDMVDPNAVVHAIEGSGARSALDLFCAAETNPDVRSLLDDGLRFPVMGATTEFSALLKEPHSSALAALDAAQLALGLARARQLYLCLMDLLPVDALYDPQERELYEQLFPKNIRMANAAWGRLKGEADFIKDYIDRRERLAGIWLLHPIGPPLNRYMTELGKVYAEGHDGAAVAFCRALVENAVRLAVPEAVEERTERGKGPTGARISWLRDQQRLTPDAVVTSREIWKDGSDAVHLGKLFDEDAFTTLEGTMRVLAELAPLLRESRSA